MHGLILTRFESAPGGSVDSWNRRWMAACEVHWQQEDGSPFLPTSGDGVGNWHPPSYKDSHNGVEVQMRLGIEVS